MWFAVRPYAIWLSLVEQMRGYNQPHAIRQFSCFPPSAAPPEPDKPAHPSRWSCRSSSTTNPRRNHAAGSDVENALAGSRGRKLDSSTEFAKGPSRLVTRAAPGSTQIYGRRSFLYTTGSDTLPGAHRLYVGWWRTEEEAVENFGLRSSEESHVCTSLDGPWDGWQSVGG